MRAITLWQPWATLVAVGVKTVETRSWSTSYRGPLAIHAAVRFLYDLDDLLDADGRFPRPWQLWRNEDGETPWHWFDGAPGTTWPLGALVAICDLVDCVPIVGPGDVVGRSVLVTNEASIGYPGPAGSPWGWQFPPGYGPTDTDTGSHIGWTDLRAQLPFGDFTPGRFAWLLEDVRALPEPIPCRGRQRIWRLPPNVASALAS